METLQAVMTSPVISVAPDQPVSHALAIMEERRISALVVAENNKPLGVFTERALIQIRVSGTIEYSWPIHRVMSSPPFTAPVDMDYREGYQLLLNHRIRHLVVIDHHGNLVGIITGTDFLSHLGLEYFMEFKNVDQVMVRDVLTLQGSASAFTAMRLMNDRRISSLVIEEDGYPEGIVTERDLLRLIRARVNLEDVRLEEVMSRPVRTVFADVSSHKAARVLLENRLRRLVVTNSSGKAIGIITETDMIKGLRTSYTDHLKKVIQRQEDQLKEAKQQVEEALILESMLRSAADIGIVIMDPERNIVLCNQAAEMLYDVNADRITGSSADRLHATARDPEQFARAVAVADEEGRHEFILEQKRPGSLRYLATTLFAIRDRQQVKKGYGLICQDVTRHKKGVRELEQKKKEAEEANIALKVMLDQHTRAKESLEEKVAIRLQELVHPYLDLLRQSSLSDKQAETVHIIGAHIDAITHSFSPKARKIILGLSPRETLIADLVRQGKTSKDIAEILNISVRTVETYRNNLRKKLALSNKKISLRTYLLTHFAS